MNGALILALIEVGVKVADRVITIMQNDTGGITIIDYSKTTQQGIDDLLNKIDARLAANKTVPTP